MDSDPIDSEEVLLRQVHPTFIVDGKLSSQPFQPTLKDGGKLSVDRSTLTTPGDAHTRHVGNGFQSAAVYGLTAGEFGEHTISCVADPKEAIDKLAANPAHALADYTAIKPGKHKQIAQRLKVKALLRGQLYPETALPTSESSDAA